MMCDCIKLNVFADRMFRRASELLFSEQIMSRAECRVPECRDSRVYVHLGKLRNGQFVEVNRHIVLTTGHVINFNIVSSSELARQCAGECVTV